MLSIVEVSAEWNILSRNPSASRFYQRNIRIVYKIFGLLDRSQLGFVPNKCLSRRMTVKQTTRGSIVCRTKWSMNIKRQMIDMLQHSLMSTGKRFIVFVGSYLEGRCK